MVLLNLDAGEHDDEPEELWALADVLSIACGGHTGDDRSMTRVVGFCAGRSRPRIGAHPSYPDRLGFGRRSLTIEPQALRATVLAQCAALARIAAAHRQRVEWVKPHGALYHDAAKDLSVAHSIIDAAIEALGTDVAVIGPPNSVLEQVAAVRSLRYFREGFADRATRADGSLVPRSEPDALITDLQQVAARARALDVETVCVHADTPGALAIARTVRSVLDSREA
ncbi:MAG TPA: LamB/YcsF family protein [Kofleriaceae bacterium]